MKSIKVLIAVSVMVILSATLVGRAAADPVTTYRAKNGALCTADMVYRSGDGPAPFFIFKYQGPHGIASMIFRMGEYYGMPAVYAERVTLGNGTTTVLAPFGTQPAVTFGQLFEFDIAENGVPQASKRLSLFAVGANLQQVLLTAVTDFCEDFDPAYFSEDITPSTPIATPTRTPTPTPAMTR
jgi:hypothetical protein